MTRRKTVADDSYSQLELGQYRLRKLAILIASGKELPLKLREDLAARFWCIGEGMDANEAFGVKAKRGERKTAEEAAKGFKIRAATMWVATAIKQPPDGLGISLTEAFERAEKAFGYSYDTLVTYRRDYPEWRNTTTFSRPISSFPG
jgi:hypothetical protein